MSGLESNNHFTVAGWMVTDLHLEGLELMVYALIFNFSQGRAGVYKGGVSYLCEWFGITKPTAIKYLKGLVEKGLIERQENSINGVIFVDYTLNKEILRGVKNFNGGGKEFLPKSNNRENIPPYSEVYISKDIYPSTYPPKGESASKSSILQKFIDLGCDPATLQDWKAARKGAPITESVLQGMLREAKKAGITLADAVRICAEHSWRGFRADYLHSSSKGQPEKKSNTPLLDVMAKFNERWSKMGGTEQ